MARREPSDETRQLNLHIDKKVWAFVEFYAIEKDITKGEAMEELILIGWKQHKIESDSEVFKT